MKPVQMVGMLMALLVLYLLSPGPVVLYYKRINPSHPPPQVVLTILGPLDWLYRHNDTVKESYDSYLHLWGAR